MTCAALAAFSVRSEAEPVPVDARVVWARADRAYLAAADSIALAPGDLVTVRRGKKTVASGEVAEVLARDLAAAHLTAGSLEHEKKLDRLRVFAERPPLRPLPLLRIGYPGRGRANLLFACEAPRPRVAGFRTDSLAENAYRFVREEAAATWPDTILARLFGESADEEIALERGELDVAVFWPGEASSRLRADPRWQRLGYGARGVLAALGPAGGTRDTSAAISPDLPPLAALNAELFRGDLAPVPGAAASAARAPSPALRFEVDPSCPGRAAIERCLARATPAGPRDSSTVRLAYLDLHAPPPPHATLFTVRCPIAFDPVLRRHLAALGFDSIAALLECGPPTP
jgi:hypothetical protein